MIDRRKALISALIALDILLVSFLFHYPYLPRYKAIGPDSGMFAYTGSQILEGKLLYRDVWDEKPPGVYYLNALALGIGGNSPWTIWWLDMSWMSAAVLALFLIMQRIAGWLPALLGTILFLVTVMYPDYYQKGNLTEIYALLPQVLSIGILWKVLTTWKKGWIACLGVVTAAAFILKPTYIALGGGCFAVILYLDLRLKEYRKAAGHTLAYGLGAILPLAAAALVWIGQGAFRDLWYALFEYNVQYVQGGFSITNLHITAINLTITQPVAALFALSATAWGVFITMNGRTLIRPQKDRIYTPDPGEDSAARLWVFAGAFIALPVELALISISGKNFGHYFVTPLPAMAVCCTWLFMKMGQARAIDEQARLWKALSIALLACVGFAWALEAIPREFPKPALLADLLKKPLYETYHPSQMEQYIIDNSQPEDSVLVWDVHPEINWLTGRRSPTRYAFILPLVMASQEAGARMNEFIAGLRSDPPALILTQPGKDLDVPYFGDPRAELCAGCTPEIRTGMIELKQFVQEHYRLAKTIANREIYQRK